ncbi:MAG: CHASE domain-containing protein [Burkholderiales bacterium]
MTRERIVRRMLLILVTAVCGLSLALGSWRLARENALSEARARFNLQVAEIVLEIRDRMLDYEQVLRGGVALFSASERVDREEWRAYAETTKVASVYPGILGFGFAPYVSSDGRRALEDAARQQGLQGYAVFPAGSRSAYVPVLFLVPENEVNRRALGYDMYSEGARRDAIERARDAGSAAITRVVALVQDAGSAAQAAFLMYLPVYRKGASIETVSGRRAAIEGFVYAPFRFSDLMAGSVGRRPGLALQLVDSTGDGATAELHRSPGWGTRRDSPKFASVQEFHAAQRAWRLEVQSLPTFEAEMADYNPEIVLASGLAITSLLLLVVWTLATTRERARELAHHMTVALRASEERLKLALASSRLALFDWDVASGLVQLSAEWSAMLGGASEPTLTPIQKLQAIDHPEDFAAVQSKLNALLRGDADSLRYEHRVRCQDGSWLWIETVARVNGRALDGRALRVMGANANIEERKAVERMKNEFIATVNHELRTPLTSMLGSLGLVREGSAGELPPDARRFVDIAYENSERLVKLVNDILDIERVEAGRLPMRAEVVETGALLRRALELNAAYAERHGVRLVLAAHSELAPVRADPDRLMQVLANLLSNAAKYSPRSGEVTLSSALAGERVRISVTDRGPGISAEFLPRLFGRFEQADGAQAGTGLGLAISKALVERMGGRIGCDSEPGRGATFWFELPKA